MNSERLLEKSIESTEIIPNEQDLTIIEESKIPYGNFEYTRRTVEVNDSADPFYVEMMNVVGDRWESEMLVHPEWEAPVADSSNPGRLIIPEDNKAALWLYREWESEKDTGAVEAWASTLFPTAKALFPMQRLEDGGRVLPDGDIDERAVFLFSHMLDGIGLRSRAKIYADILTNSVKEFADKDVSIVSLGCGAGVPNIEATVKVEKETDKTLNWDLYDLDTEALAFAKELVEESEVEKSTFNYGRNGISSRSFARAFKLKPESVDVVDALGLWEYVGPKAAVKFAQRAYNIVKPGGRLVISNMLPDRPQREFNQRAVGWPSLHLRSEEDLVGIFSDAGIDISNITATHSTDGVYVVLDVKKPW